MSKKTVLGLSMALLAIDVYAATTVNRNTDEVDGKIALSWAATGDAANIQVMHDTDSTLSGRQRFATLGGTARNYEESTAVNGRQSWSWIKYTDAKKSTGHSTISPDTASFDKNVAKRADIAVYTTLNGNTLNAIRNGGATLLHGTDYTVSGSTITLSKRYLAKQAIGAVSLTFDFSAGTDPVLPLQITDSTAVAVNYTLNVTAKGKGSTNIVSGIHTYAAGTSITLTAMPETGYVFSGWSGTVTGDTNPVTLRMNGNKSLTANFSADYAQAFVHMGLLHTQADFDRIHAQVESGTSPWKDGGKRPTKNGHSALTWTPNLQPIVYRGSDGRHAENYGVLYNDIAEAYALALRRKVGGAPAVSILDACSETLTALNGGSDKFLASGLYGYQSATAAEIMRRYQKWPAANLKRFQDMMPAIFYPMNHAFLAYHNGSRVEHYWAHRDIANMTSMFAFGMLTGRRDIYDETIEYFNQGAGYGATGHVIWKLYLEENLGQARGSGRAQGHNTLQTSLLVDCFLPDGLESERRPVRFR